MQVADKIKDKLTVDEFQKVLDACYGKAVSGIVDKGNSASDLACKYLDRYQDKSVAAKKMINMQVIKCTTSGFITGLGGLITLPVAVPANIASVLYVQLRMITTTAFMGGYNIDSDEVKTLVYACLAGVSVIEVVKKCGIQFGEKFAAAMVKKIPRSVLTKINQTVGFKFVTKFGEKGLINLGTMIPVVGAAINGGFDWAETKIIANRAYKWFMTGDFSCKEGSVSAVEDCNIIDDNFVSSDDIQEI